MFQHAIVRPPGANFADGLTTVSLGAPDVGKALDQHERYCRALEECGLSLIRLAADAYPDSTFVEDTAVLAESCAVLCRPGADSRAGEVAEIREVLSGCFPRLFEIREPGTVDGGDVCEAGERFFIGISNRTNEEGAKQLEAFLEDAGYAVSLVDIRKVQGILHLKSGMAWLGERMLAVIAPLSSETAFEGYQIVPVPSGEEYAANCLRVNDRVLLAAGYPKMEEMLREQGCPTVVLDMSEFRKMDGGLSCLSLRF